MAAVDYLLVMDGIEGETTDTKMDRRKLWNLTVGPSENRRLGHSSQGSGGGAGKVSMQDVHFVRK